MEFPRRRFLRSATGFLAACALEPALGSDPPAAEPPDMGRLLRKAGFDPDEPGAAVLAVAADLHIYLDPAAVTSFNDRFNDNLISEINSLQPQVTHVVLAGDLVVSHSVTAGTPRYAPSYAIARQEFRTVRAQLGRFRQDIATYCVPGNHDTDNQETDAELWREELQMPPYGRTEMGGVPVLMLNSGHGGALDPAQEKWFEEQVESISPDREVLIIAHHPVLYHLAGETGLKYTLARVFRNHRAPIWVIGGHGHVFEDRLFVHRGVSFVQMEVTSGSTKVFNDGKASGYAILGLSGGKVRARIFRSIGKNTTVVRPTLPSMTPGVFRWAFDQIACPAALFIEGQYDRSGRVVSFLANDVRTHFLYVQHIVYRLDLKLIRGKAADFLIHAGIAPNVLPSMSCSFSAGGPNGPWTAAPFPTEAEGSCVYRIPIPEIFREEEELHVRVATSITRYGASLTIDGWGITAREEKLTNYERWLARIHRTIVPGPSTVPDASPPGDTLSNAEYFAFNLPVPNQDEHVLTSLPTSPISGAPVTSSVPLTTCDFRFAKRRNSSAKGITYVVEESESLQTWRQVTSKQCVVTGIDSEWEEVRISSAKELHPCHFYRVRIEPLARPWRSPLPDTDTGRDEDERILAYAFGMPGRNAQQYDPARKSSPTGEATLTSTKTDHREITFIRMKSSSRSGVSYMLERKNSQGGWDEVHPADIHETILQTDEGWEKVRQTVLSPQTKADAFRIRPVVNEPFTPVSQA